MTTYYSKNRERILTRSQEKRDAILKIQSECNHNKGYYEAEKGWLLCSVCDEKMACIKEEV